MNLKNFIIGGILGGIVDFLLGWVFYGMLFKNIYPPSENENLTFIFLGCLTYAFLLSFVFNKWAHIAKFTSGVTAGAIIGFFYGLSMNFFMYSNMAFNPTNMLLDVAINIFMSAIVGGVIGLISGKLK
ncbi:MULTISPECIES: hypothetical protein [unclassified Flavobacterium]|uniref:hypothetical protein n=1 Tax=unclassified Flavobacterium TaxID=196869 RepID=UPI003611DC44